MAPTVSHGFEMRVFLGKEALSFYYFLHTFPLLWKYYERKKLVLQEKREVLKTTKQDEQLS